MRLTKNVEIENELIKILSASYTPTKMRAKLILDVIESHGYVDSKDGELTCPFCGDGSGEGLQGIPFDKAGLKYHLEKYCEKYNDSDGLEK
jgi:hypothetical protein